MISPTSSFDPMRDVYQGATERGRVHRAFGGGYQSGVCTIDYDASNGVFALLHFPARYPRARYGMGEVLVPEEPIAVERCTGMETITQETAIRAYASGIQPVNVQTQRFLMELMGHANLIPPEIVAEDPENSVVTVASSA